MLVVKPEGGPAAGVKPTEELCEIKWEYHIVGMMA
jgi:hypothetical protein